jgi:hypothetical protein
VQIREFDTKLNHPVDAFASSKHIATLPREDGPKSGGLRAKPTNWP